MMISLATQRSTFVSDDEQFTNVKLVTFDDDESQRRWIFLRNLWNDEEKKDLIKMQSSLDFHDPYYDDVQ